MTDPTTGNTSLPGVATEPRHRARSIENDVLADLDHALRWATDACVPTEYVETLLPAMLWAVDKAAAALTPVERHLKVVA